MELSMQYKKGYTLIEVLVVVVILGILLALAVTSFPSLFDRRSLEGLEQQTISLLEEARARTLSSHEASAGSGEGSAYGVYFDTTNNELELFSGTSYETANAVKVVAFGENFLFSIDFGDQVSFERLTGRARQTGTITITEQSSGNTEEITIDSSGRIQ